MSGNGCRLSRTWVAVSVLAAAHATGSAELGAQSSTTAADGSSAQGAYAATCTSPSSRDPSWSPDGTRIFFSSDRSGSQEIWSMKADGSNVRQLTRTGKNLYYPSASLDGQRVAFTVIDSLGQRVGLASADGGEVTYLTEIDDQGADPIWLPGGRLIYSSARGGDRDLWISDLSGPGSRLFALEGEEWAPRLSPSGDRILFSTDRDGNGEVYTAGLDGSDPRNLSRSEATWDGVPSWAPSGQQVVYYSRVLPDTAGPAAARASWATADLKVVDLQGGTVRPLTSNRYRDQSPSWSPDGQRVAFVSCATGGLEIWLIDADGTNPRRLTYTVEHADSTAIIEAVRTYVEGWRAGNVERLATALAPEGALLWMADGGLRSMTFADALSNRRPNPGYGEPWELRSMRIVDGRVAVVEAMIAYQAREVEFTDLLTLHRFEDGWKIVTKAFSARPD